MNGALCIPMFVPLRGKGKVDHQDRVLRDQADQQHDSNEGNHVEVHVKDHQG